MRYSYVCVQSSFFPRAILPYLCYIDVYIYFMNVIKLIFLVQTHNLFNFICVVLVNGLSVDKMCTAIPFPEVSCSRDSPAKYEPCLTFCQQKFGSVAVAECVYPIEKGKLFCLCVDCKDPRQIL